jgi:hypothetical protein
MLKDKDTPASRKMVLASAAGIDGFAGNLKRIVYSKKVDSSSGLSDFFSIALGDDYAPMGSECTLTGSMMSTTFGLSSLTDDGKWVFWADNVDTSVGVGDGKLSNLESCATDNFGKLVWAWDPVLTAGFIENDDSDGIDATIRIVDLSKGKPAAPTAGMCSFAPAGDCIQKDADVTYSIPYPKYDMVVYAINKASPMTDGLWIYNKLPWAGSGPPPDAGTDTGSTD